MTYNFPITVYSNLEPYNDVLTKARCRIFYKYGNRNGTYITEAFADKLVSSLPYVPVKGIYSGTDEDFTDHGASRDLGKIYGIVPEQPNVSWETFPDADGTMHEYACCDVLLFTGIYKEANEIIGKAQSMELYAPSLKGEWQEIEGARYYVFTEGSFLGLQALGEKAEPCFEDAAFYELREQYNSLKDLLDKLLVYTNEEGGKTMGAEEEKKVDAAAAQEETPPPEPEGEHDQPAATQLETETKKTYTVSEAEYNLLAQMYEWNGKTYDGLYQKVIDLVESNSTFKQQNEALQTENTALKEKVAAYEKEKVEAETAQKEAIREKYSKLLSEDEIKAITIEDKSVEELEKCYAYAVVKANEATLFSSSDGRIPKESHSSGIESILDKYM